MTDFDKPVYSRPDGTYVATVNGYPYHVIESDPLFSDVEAYLAEHPEALVPEPVPEPPSKEELERLRVVGIQSQLDALDRKSIRALRSLIAGNPTAEDNAVLADLDAKAEQLRAGL